MNTQNEIMAWIKRHPLLTLALVFPYFSGIFLFLWIKSRDSRHRDLDSWQHWHSVLGKVFK